MLCYYCCFYEETEENLITTPIASCTAAHNGANNASKFRELDAIAHVIVVADAAAGVDTLIFPKPSPIISNTIPNSHTTPSSIKKIAACASGTDVPCLSQQLYIISYPVIVTCA